MTNPILWLSNHSWVILIVVLIVLGIKYGLKLSKNPKFVKFKNKINEVIAMRKQRKNTSSQLMDHSQLPDLLEK
jgi:hypothetical protein